MKINELEDYLTKEKSYQIRIELGDDLEAVEIAECFKEQYPKNRCTILSTKATQLSFEVLIIGGLR